MRTLVLTTLIFGTLFFSRINIYAQAGKDSTKVISLSTTDQTNKIDISKDTLMRYGYSFKYSNGALWTSYQLGLNFNGNFITIEGVGNTLNYYLLSMVNKIPDGERIFVDNIIAETPDRKTIGLPSLVLILR